MLNQRYIVKWSVETAFALLVAVVTYVGVELAATDISTIDPAALAVAIVSGAGRVAVAVLFNAVRKLFTGE